MLTGKPEQKVERRRDRLWLGMVAGSATASLYAEGVLKNGLLLIPLLAPIAWFLLGPRVTPFRQNLLVLLTAVCLTISASDLLLRPFLDRRLNYTALNVYSHKLPTLPIVGRWDANLNVADVLWGDLAAIAGDPALREPREIAFRTDSSGFRNTAVNSPLDLIVLGDSFGAGWGTTQDRIFAGVLASRYGHRVYNLSFPGGPYDQYVNFAVESPRLRFAPGATVVWTFYTGNDLDDAGGETWDVAAFPWQSGFDAWRVTYRTFRNRSPLNRLLEGLRARWNRDAGQVLRRSLPDGRPILFHPGQEPWSRTSRSEVERAENFAKLVRTMTAMKRLTDEKGLRLMVFILPTKGDVYRWILEQRRPQPDDRRPTGWAQAVLAVCERIPLQCRDTKPYLVEEAQKLFESSGELLWWRDDTHLGERGHAAVAAFIHEQVQSTAALR